MFEPAAREDGGNTTDAQQSQRVLAAAAAMSVNGHVARAPRITADSFKALTERLRGARAVSSPVSTPAPVMEVPEPVAPPVVEVQIDSTAEIRSLELPEPVDIAYEVPAPVIAAEPPPFVAPEIVEPLPPEPVPVEPEPEPKSGFDSWLPPVETVTTYVGPVAEPVAPEPHKIKLDPLSVAPGHATRPPDIDEVLSAVFGAVLEVHEKLDKQVPDVPPELVHPEPIILEAEIPATGIESLPEVAAEPELVEATADADEFSANLPDALETPAEIEPVAAKPEPEPEPEPEVREVIAVSEPVAAAPQPKPQPEPVVVSTPVVTEPPPKRETSLLRKQVETRADPFAETLLASAVSSAPAVEIAEPDPQSGETAKSLLDIMSASSSIVQPQERALAADTLLRLIPRVPEKMLIALAERVAIMEFPPPLLVTRLIRDPRPDVAGPLLEKASNIPDRDLITVIAESDPLKLRMIARRRHLSAALVEALIATGDESVHLTLVRNPGATPSHEAFHVLGERAKAQASLQAPLVTRPDTPVPTAFELFWFVPAELRRFILSRFLTDSENLNRILKIALATAGDEMKSVDEATEIVFPERQKVEALVVSLTKGEIDRAVAELSEMAKICETNARRIIADEHGEPLTIALKVLGYPRAKFTDAIAALQQSPSSNLRGDRNPAELQSIFDSMSFNKARVLLTYWDWSAQKSGPYTQIAA
jgi:hypothetical protein